MNNVKKTLILSCLFFMYSFTKLQPVDSSIINNKFSHVSSLLAQKDVSIVFSNFTTGEVVLKDKFEFNFDKLRDIGIAVPMIQEDKFIKSADFNSIFDTMLSNTLLYNSAPRLVTTTFSIEATINLKEIVPNTIINYENDQLTYELTIPPSNGTLIVEGGVYKYLPNLNHYGTDTFTYRVFDGLNYSNVAKVNVATKGKGIVENSGVKTFFDGTLKKSCNEYMISSGPIYNYSGSTGDGVYKIQYGSEIVNVFCDMTNHGGGWTLAVKMGNIANNATAVRTLSTGAISTNYLENNSFNGMGNVYGKLSNSMINGIKNSTETNRVSYRWERHNDIPLFLSGACVFQAKSGAASGNSADYCTKRATTWNATTFRNNPNPEWCVQTNMPHVYFCTDIWESFQVVDGFESSTNHNWPLAKIWIK